MDRKKSIDGFIPTKHNTNKSHASAVSKGGRGIPASEMLEKGDEFMKDIVPLPAPNGNDLKVKSYDDFVGAKGAKREKPVRTIDDFLSSADDNEHRIDPDRPMSRTRGGLLPDYEEDSDDGSNLDGPMEREIEREREKPAKKSLKKLLFWQKDAKKDEPKRRASETEEQTKVAADGLDDDHDAADDDFDIYNERPKQQESAQAVDIIKQSRNTAVAKEYADPDSEDDLDNDLNVDDDDIERYRSRRFKRESKENFQDESNVVLRVIGGAVIVVVTIIITYFLFTLFYNAPEPAKIDSGANTSNSNSTDNNSNNNQQNQQQNQPPVEVPEIAPTIAVYNATNTSGAAAALTSTLVGGGEDAIVGGNTVMSGTGFAILDFTNGQKPKGLDAVKSLIGGVVEVIPITSVTNLPADVRTDRDFVIIIR